MSADPLADGLRAIVGDRVRVDAPLAPLTTLRVGGPARALVTVEDDAEIAAVGTLAAESGAPCVVIGRGSNMLVDDRGWAGVALVLGSRYRGVDVEGTRVTAGAAEPLPALATRLADAGLAGFSWAVAVPGTLGGAVRMNAGAHGGQMADHLIDCTVVDLLGPPTRRTIPLQDLDMTYRRTALTATAVVVAARLRLSTGTADAIREEMAAIRAWRRAHQPLHEPNCGSVFTNPAGDSAGRLIESVGLKGLSIGGASVSERHANFIVTRPGARAADVSALIDEVRARVLASTGVDLRPEVVRLDDGTQARAGVG